MNTQSVEMLTVHCHNEYNYSGNGAVCSSKEEGVVTDSVRGGSGDC